MKHKTDMHVLFFSAMQEDYSNNEKNLIDLSEEIEKLNQRMITYLDFIQDRSANYRNCIPE